MWPCVYSGNPGVSVQGLYRPLVDQVKNDLAPVRERGIM
jgi:hypothetical protein